MIHSVQRFLWPVLREISGGALAEDLSEAMVFESESIFGAGVFQPAF